MSTKVDRPGICVISKVHAVEPFELPDDAFWRESMLVARRLNDLVRPVNSPAVFCRRRQFSIASEIVSNSRA